jgi:TfoX/Sxy family transcriptional regulator of competence genes
LSGAGSAAAEAAHHVAGALARGALVAVALPGAAALGTALGRRLRGSGLVVVAGVVHTVGRHTSSLPRRLPPDARREVHDDVRMAYDEDLANRIRELMAGEADVTEKRMFGGLAFLVSGNMSVAASGQGGLMVRVDPDQTEALIQKPHARPFEMRGREMQGWLRVDPEGVRTKRQLEPWVRRGVTYARSLPRKG